VGSEDTAEEEKTVPEAKPVTALLEKETWTSLVKLVLRSRGMVGGVCARAAERRVRIVVVRWRKQRAMAVSRWG
jgi:hypothetical protein